MRDFSFFIDRGGTFTDVVALLPDNTYKTFKLLSVDPDNYEDAPREGIRRVLEAELKTKFPKKKALDTTRIKSIRMGTTVATNALLERKGAPTCMVVTKGFRDLWRIGNQSRPKIFELDIKKTKPDVLYRSVVEVDERIILKDSLNANGREVRVDKSTIDFTKGIFGVTGEEIIIEQVPNALEIEKDLRKAFNEGLRSVAVCLMHAAIYPDHEKLIGGICKRIGFEQISLSHEVMNMVKIVPRGYTTTADAYLTPHIVSYISQFVSGFDKNLLKSVNVSFMQSDGALSSVSNFSGHRAILSGPAGGVVGFATTSFLEPVNLEKSGVKIRKIKPVIGFDMGGTSTDVSRFAGEFDHVFETTTAGVTIQAPQLDISTVAAGGGSKLAVANGMLVVGPESVGAHPGPICYRKTKYSEGNAKKDRPDGDLAVTDANLFLGRLIPELFPKIFGPNEDQPLDVDATTKAFEDITRKINFDSASSKDKSAHEVALGFIDVANEAMSRPIRAITQMKGYNLKNHTLACFGGAGGQHACGIARKLGMSSIFIHRFSGVLSALGIGLAVVAEEKQLPVSLTLATGGREGSKAVVKIESANDLRNIFESLESDASYKLREDNGIEGQLKVERFLNLRYEGTDCNLMIRCGDDFAQVCDDFVKNHKREFGFIMHARNIVVDDARVRVSENSQKSLTSITSSFIHQDSCKYFSPKPSYWKSVYYSSGFENTEVFKLDSLIEEIVSKGASDICRAQITGPAIITTRNATVVLEPDWGAEVSADGDILLNYLKSNNVHAYDSGTERYYEADPVELSIYSHRFMSIAEQMGKTLQRTSVSVNIKERLDFSCALFSAKGDLIANAPHIPVHLGAMQEAVRSQITFWEHPTPDIRNHIMLPLLKQFGFSEGINEGDVFVSNHPQRAGGSHLPDITVITPVFFNGEIVFWVANRGHHADVGGITPGSMPPDSVKLSQEGCAIITFKLVDRGEFQEEHIRQMLAAAGARGIEDNVSDLRAQVAANNSGIDLVHSLIQEESLTKVQAYMNFILLASENAVRDMLKYIAKEAAKKQNGQAVFLSEDFMDDETSIKLKIMLDQETGSAVFDFSGTGPQVYGNTNAPPAVSYSAIIYCLRCMLSLGINPDAYSDIPLNQGCLAPVKIILPEKSILLPDDEAAVVGGNVLTSQRLVDVIFKAFQCVSASQGCTNNVTFGDQKFGYYETVAGGAGAGEGFDGQDGVHTHMTNTRITDPEILERRYPVILRQFTLRNGSGGQGRWSGGNGVVREIEFRRPLNVSLLTERRNPKYKPYGLFGAESGSSGENWFYKAGIWKKANSKVMHHMLPSERVLLKTPGGGGFGSLQTSAKL